jgi:hypothetical protein
VRRGDDEGGSAVVKRWIQRAASLFVRVLCEDPGRFQSRLAASPPISSQKRSGLSPL